MKVSVIKSTNRVAIGNINIKNEHLVNMILAGRKLKNKLRSKRRTHWIKVRFEKDGATVILSDFDVYQGDYDLFVMDEHIKHIVPIEDTLIEEQYVCEELGTMRIIQTPTLMDTEEIIIVYTDLQQEESESKQINMKLVETMKQYLFRYQMQVYIDHEGTSVDKAFLNLRIEQIVGILEGIKEIKTILIEEGQEATEFGFTIEREARYFKPDMEQNGLDEQVDEIVEEIVDQIVEADQESASIEEKQVELEEEASPSVSYRILPNIPASESLKELEALADEEEESALRANESVQSERTVHSDSKSKDEVKYIKLNL